MISSGAMKNDLVRKTRGSRRVDRGTGGRPGACDIGERCWGREWEKESDKDERVVIKKKRQEEGAAETSGLWEARPPRCSSAARV